MRNRFLILFMFFPVLLKAQDGEIRKTGYNFGPLPTIGYDADKGLLLGALCEMYNFGDGSLYPNFNSMTYFEIYHYSKGSWNFDLGYDNRTLIPGVRLSAACWVSLDKAMDFFGFDGYRAWYNASPNVSYTYTPFYRYARNIIGGYLDFTGRIVGNLSWEIGIHPQWIKTAAIDRISINKNKSATEAFPDSVATLYEDYLEWGLIPKDEAAGGFIGAVRLGLMYDTRDKESAPTRGIWAEGHLNLAPGWLGTTHPFYRYSLSWRHYLPIVSKDVLTFAYRLGYEGTIGSYAPWYVIPFTTGMGQTWDYDGVGGYGTVRGLMACRVIGLDVALLNAELRWRFARFTLWKQNIAFGLNVFTEGAMVTRAIPMSFSGNASDLSAYEEYISKGLSSDKPHVTVGSGLRFIMNENFIIAVEAGVPVGPNRKQDGPFALYINTGYML